MNVSSRRNILKLIGLAPIAAPKIVAAAATAMKRPSLVGLSSRSFGIHEIATRFSIDARGARAGAAAYADALAKAEWAQRRLTWAVEARQAEIDQASSVEAQMRAHDIFDLPEAA